MLYNGEIAYLQSGVQAGLVDESVASLRNLLLLMVPIVLILCVGGGYLLAGRALRPIESVTRGTRSNWTDESRLAADGPAGGG